MTDKLKFPASMSETAQSLLDGLLQRNLDERLKDPRLIKQHPWFASIDWQALVEKKIPPPFIPDVVNHIDLYPYYLYLNLYIYIYI